MTPNEIRDEIARLTAQLNKTQRGFKVTIECYTEDESADSVESSLEFVFPVLRELDFNDICFNVEET